MRTFLGVLMVLIVSGDDRTIRGVLKGSVLLPCNCSGRDLEFKWQMDKPELVLRYNRTFLNYGRFEGRTKIFVEEDSNNCSFLLTNITADDHGEYKCIFHSKDIYQRLAWNLNVSVIYSVCQKNSSSSVFQCEVQGRYADAEIQWKLDERLLTNSPTIQINHSSSLDTPPDIYLFKSELISKLNMTSVPTCYIEAKGISAIMNYECGGVTDSIKTDPRRDCSMRYLKIIPVVLALGLFLVLWRHRKFSQGKKTRDPIDERPEGEAMMPNGG